MNNIARVLVWLIVGAVVVACTYMTGSRVMIAGLLAPLILEGALSNENTSLDETGEDLDVNQEGE